MVKEGNYMQFEDGVFMDIYVGSGSIMQICGKRVLVVTLGFSLCKSVVTQSFCLANLWRHREWLCKLVVTST